MRADDHSVQDPEGTAFRQLRRTHDLALRNQLVEAHTWIIEPIVHRLCRNGVALDDLRQVALIGLIDAVGRFDPDRGVTFRTYASRTVEGVCKHHLRDGTWMVRPPRRLHDAHLRLRRAIDELTHQLGTSPTPAALAAHLEWTVEQVLEAMEVGSLRRLESFDQPQRNGDDTEIEATGPVHLDPDRDDRLRLVAALRRLPPKDREIVVRRYWNEWTQEELSRSTGVSQSFMSRKLRHVEAALRADMDGGA
jgi:RNA polymerase sigma-B factor